ncbi:MAG: glycosyltransferase [Tissierellia bacterium]|nr:glycosyltransferase [Tissierellia bacterium]
MEKEKICILITMEYPFLKGETFLESEVVYLANNFDYVLVFALNGFGSQTRGVPKNVECIAVKNTKGLLRYVKYAFNGIIGSGIVQRRELFKSPNILGFLSSLYARGRVNASYKKILALLNDSLSSHNPKSILFYSYWFMDQALLAVLISDQFKNACDTKVISRAHGYDLYEYRNKTNYIPFRNLVFKKIDMVYPCSKDGASYLKAKYPQYTNKIEVAYLGSADNGIQKLSNKIKGFHIVSCSSLIPLKRNYLIAEALAILKEKGIHDIHWTCIGSGPEESRIIKIINNNDLKQQVLLTGNLTNSQVMSNYRENYYDLFVNVSTAEGLPVSIMEAQSFGIPSIATNVGGTKEIVSEKTGKLLPSNLDSALLADTILEFYNMTIEQKTVLRDAARNNWEKKFNSERNYSKW